MIETTTVVGNRRVDATSQPIMVRPVEAVEKLIALLLGWWVTQRGTPAGPFVDDPHAPCHHRLVSIVFETLRIEYQSANREHHGLRPGHGAGEDLVGVRVGHAQELGLRSWSDNRSAWRRSVGNEIDECGIWTTTPFGIGVPATTHRRTAASGSGAESIPDRVVPNTGYHLPGGGPGRARASA